MSAKKSLSGKNILKLSLTPRVNTWNQQPVSESPSNLQMHHLQLLIFLCTTFRISRFERPKRQAYCYSEPSQATVPGFASVSHFVEGPVAMLTGRAQDANMRILAASAAWIMTPEFCQYHMTKTWENNISTGRVQVACTDPATPPVAVSTSGKVKCFALCWASTVWGRKKSYQDWHPKKKHVKQSLGAWRASDHQWHEQHCLRMCWNCLTRVALKRS
jgi:hypothetical protein